MAIDARRQRQVRCADGGAHMQPTTRARVMTVRKERWAEQRTQTAPRPAVFVASGEAEVTKGRRIRKAMDGLRRGRFNNAILTCIAPHPNRHSIHRSQTRRSPKPDQHLCCYAFVIDVALTSTADGA